MWEDIRRHRVRKRGDGVRVRGEGRRKEPSVVVEVERWVKEFPCAVNCVEAGWRETYTPRQPIDALRGRSAKMSRVEPFK